MQQLVLNLFVGVLGAILSVVFALKSRVLFVVLIVRALILREDLSRGPLHLLALHPLLAELAGIDRHLLDPAANRHEAREQGHQVHGLDMVPVHVDDGKPVRDLALLNLLLVPPQADARPRLLHVVLRLRLLLGFRSRVRAGVLRGRKTTAAGGVIASVGLLQFATDDVVVLDLDILLASFVLVFVLLLVQALQSLLFGVRLQLPAVAIDLCGGDKVGILEHAGEALVDLGLEVLLGGQLVPWVGLEAGEARVGDAAFGSARAFCGFGFGHCVWGWLRLELDCRKFTPRVCESCESGQARQSRFLRKF